MHTVQADDRSNLHVVGDHPHEKFVVLRDAHGGIHLIPAEYYGELQEQTREISAQIETRRSELAAVLASSLVGSSSLAGEDLGDPTGLTEEVRALRRLRRRANRRLLG
jgi:hypothetical protein